MNTGMEERREKGWGRREEKHEAKVSPGRKIMDYLKRKDGRR